MALRPIEYTAATTLADATAIMTEHRYKAAVIAGGTDLLGSLNDNIRPEYPRLLVDIKPIAELRFIRAGKQKLRIGALTTLSELAEDPLVRDRAPLLAEAAATVASWQIRNMGTLGGNLCQEPRCWYYRTPENAFHCLRKGGQRCNALMGDNRFHSIYGGSRACLPGCSAECPAHVPIPQVLSEIRGDDLERAAKLVLTRNPMPAITGRVCPHRCERGCSRADLDQAVSIRGIERHLGDYVLDNAARLMRPPKSPAKSSTKRSSMRHVAILGSGPAGLSAAYYLRLAGHRVTVYDRMPEAGGMLRYCIPSYRLPKDVLARQIAAYQAMGIEFKLGVTVGQGKLRFKSLHRTHDAVFLATGGWRQTRLGIEHEELLSSGLDFLVATQSAKSPTIGSRVLVVGGGNVAVDVAITAKRLGATHVSMACLEARDILPAFPEDIAQALEEGIELMPSWGPKRVLVRRGNAYGLELVRCTSVFDAQGRFRPSFDPDTTQTVEADTILVAIGQGPDVAFAGRDLHTERGLVKVDPNTQATSLKGVYAGGDAVSGAASVVEALAAGRRAAEAIEQFFRGHSDETGMASADAAPLDGAGADAETVAVNPASLHLPTRAEPCTCEPAERTLLGEDVATLTKSAVAGEAQRCANCGCVAVNASDLAPALVALEATIETTQRRLPAHRFFAAGVGRTTTLRPGELVTEVRIPATEPDSTQAYLKFRLRNAIDFPIVGLASVLTTKAGKVKRSRLVLGAVAPQPLRLREVEDYLQGKPLNEQTAEAAATLAVRDVTPLATNRYKVQIVKALIRQALLA